MSILKQWHVHSLSWWWWSQWCAWFELQPFDDGYLSMFQVAEETKKMKVTTLEAHGLTNPRCWHFALLDGLECSITTVTLIQRSMSTTTGAARESVGWWSAKWWAQTKGSIFALPNLQQNWAFNGIVTIDTKISHHLSSCFILLSSLMNSFNIIQRSSPGSLSLFFNQENSALAFCQQLDPFSFNGDSKKLNCHCACAIDSVWLERDWLSQQCSQMHKSLASWSHSLGFSQCLVKNDEFVEFFGQKEVPRCSFKF